MMSVASAIYFVLLLCGITLLVIYSRIGKLFRCMLFTASTGFFTLGLLTVLSAFTPLSFSITPLSTVVSVVLGVPGVVTMLIFNLI